MKIYTKKGDKGMTSLFGGKMMPKNALRIDAYGTVDELNSNVGLIIDSCEQPIIKADLLEIQHWLFAYGAALATPQGGKLYIELPGTDSIEKLENDIDKMEAQLQPLKHFILPSGHLSTSFTHLARCVCRRAERCIVGLNEEEEVDAELMKFFNRLSDYFFVLARYLTFLAGKEDVPWIPKHNR